ncbi:MAG: glycosyltransferase, partial [Acetobacteraceae bacterium]
MNIVHLLSGLAIGGKERVALGLAERAIGQGHSASLVLYDTPFRSAAEDFDPGGVPTYYLKRGPGLDLSFSIRLARHLRKFRPDVVHAHNDTALFYAALARAWAFPAHPRIVATFHAWPAWGGRAARWLTRAAGLSATVSAVSDDLAGRLIRSGWLFRCGVIWNGIDTDLFAPAGPNGDWREKLDLVGGDFLVGHVGRFDPVKRHRDLLEAAARVQRVRPDITFVLIGQGELLEAVRGQGAELPNLRFVRNASDMPSLLRSLDALVLCSEDEACPLALLEGMASGLPIAATAVGGVPCILRGGATGTECGLLVPPRDPESLARAILQLAGDAGLRRNLAEA